MSFLLYCFSVSFQRYEDKEDILRRSKLIRGFSEGTTGTPGVPAMGTQVNITIQDLSEKLSVENNTDNMYI